MAAGNATLWKPSPSTPLCSIAVTKLVTSVLERNGIPGAAAALVIGGKDVGEAVVESHQVDLGSHSSDCHPTGALMFSLTQFRSPALKPLVVALGKLFNPGLERFSLSLGVTMVRPSIKNSCLLDDLLIDCPASIVLSDADLDLALPAVFFGSIGTAGQRCTSTRRLFLQRSIAPTFIERLQSAYKTLRPGDPLAEHTLLGPMHTRRATSMYTDAINTLRSSGAEILAGGGLYDASDFDSDNLARGFFVRPTIAQPASSDPGQALWTRETFAPILNVAVFDELEEAIALNNSVPQGLSSSLWTRDIRNIGKWIGPAGSDCGIVNVRGRQRCCENEIIMLL